VDDFRKEYTLFCTCIYTYISTYIYILICICIPRVFKCVPMVPWNSTWFQHGIHSMAPWNSTWFQHGIHSILYIHLYISTYIYTYMHIYTNKYAYIYIYKYIYALCVQMCTCGSPLKLLTSARCTRKTSPTRRTYMFFCEFFFCINNTTYGVATMSRLLKTTGLFCQRAL